MTGKANTQSKGTAYDPKSGDESTEHFLTNPLYGAVGVSSTFQGSYATVSACVSVNIHDLYNNNASPLTFVVLVWFTGKKSTK